MTNTAKTPAQIVGALTDPLPEDADLDSLIHQAVALAREGYVPTPPFEREVWGVQVGTHPPTQYQSEELARWYFDQSRNSKTAEVRLVKGLAYSVDWQTVEIVG